MRKLLFAAALLPGLAATAQDCNTFLYMTNNAQVQMKIYDAKGKESGVQNWTITNVTKNGNGYVSTVNNVMTDEKGKEIGKSTGEYKCEGGVLKADVRMAMPAGQMGAYQPGEAKLESGYLEYPSALSAGQTLKDVDVTMDIGMAGGGMTGTADIKQMNRKVETKEPVTTPAGTWEAYKITYNSTMKIKMIVGMTMNFDVSEWFVPGVGVVKTETYRKGKLAGSTMITSIKK